MLKKCGSTRNLQRPNIEARSETHQKALTVASEVLNGIFARHAEREFKPWEASVPLSILTQNWPLGYPPAAIVASAQTRDLQSSLAASPENGKHASNMLSESRTPGFRRTLGALFSIPMHLLMYSVQATVMLLVDRVWAQVSTGSCNALKIAQVMFEDYETVNQACG